MKSNHSLARRQDGQLGSIWTHYDAEKCTEAADPLLRGPVFRPFLREPVRRLRSPAQARTAGQGSEERREEQADGLRQGRRRSGNGRPSARESLSRIVMKTSGGSALALFARVGPEVLRMIPTRRCSQDITRRYPVVLDVGSGPGYLAKHLDPEITQKVVMVDSSSESTCFVSRCRMRRAYLPCRTQKRCCIGTQTSRLRVRCSSILLVVRQYEVDEVFDLLDRPILRNTGSKMADARTRSARRADPP